MNLRKFVANNAVALTMCIPNLVVAGSIQAILLLYFHLTGLEAWLGYYFSAGCGFEAGLVVSVLTNSNFEVKVGRFRFGWNYGKAKGPRPQETTRPPAEP